LLYRHKRGVWTAIIDMNVEWALFEETIREKLKE